MFLTIFLCINSIPFAIITETGNSTYISSAPFFTGSKPTKKIPTNKLIISKYQLLLKVLLTAIVSIVLKIKAKKETIKTLIINQKYFGAS